MSCLAILSQISENDNIGNIIKKPHNFVRKTKNYLKKPQITLRNYIQRKGKKKDSWACGSFLPKSRYHSIYTLENYSNFESKFSFNNGSIFETHDDYFITGGNASFNDLSQLINTLSNQDFAGLDNFN